MYNANAQIFNLNARTDDTKDEHQQLLMNTMKENVSFKIDGQKNSDVNRRYFDQKKKCGQCFYEILIDKLE